jgi:hypothetical protein
MHLDRDVVQSKNNVWPVEYECMEKNERFKKAKYVALFKLRPAVDTIPIRNKPLA